MSLTTRQIELVEDSWDIVCMNVQKAGQIFYDRLFTIDPTLRSLFKSDINSQAEKLTSLISFVVLRLRNTDDIVMDVQALGMRHKKYNVKPEHYDTVAASLLWMLEHALAKKWNTETKDAWVAVYTILGNIMMDAENNA